MLVVFLKLYTFYPNKSCFVFFYPVSKSTFIVRIKFNFNFNYTNIFLKYYNSIYFYSILNILEFRFIL